MSDTVSIESRDYWFKVIEMLQQNWALIDAVEDGVTVYFVSDTSGVFDQISFDSVDDAKASLSENGFRRFDDDPRAASYADLVVFLRDGQIVDRLEAPTADLVLDRIRSLEI